MLTLLVLTLGGLISGYTFWKTHWAENDGVEVCTAEPGSCDGVFIQAILFDVTDIIDGEHYRIARGAAEGIVLGDTQGLAIGDVLTVAGAYNAEGRYLDEEWREQHPWFRWKKTLGIVGLGFLALFLPLRFRIRGRRLWERTWPTS